MSIFLVFPFTRLVHVWSGFGTLAYLTRPTSWCAAAASACLLAITQRSAKRTSS